MGWNPMGGMKWRRMGEMGWNRGNGTSRVEWNGLEWNRVGRTEIGILVSQFPFNGIGKKPSQLPLSGLPSNLWDAPSLTSK